MKKGWIKKISLVLSVMLFCLCLSGIAQAAGETKLAQLREQELINAAREGEKPTEQKGNPDDFVQNSPGKKRIKELSEENTEYSTSYENEDGSFGMDVSTTPIRFKDASGKLIDIDTNLVENKDGNKQKYKVKSLDKQIHIDDDIEKQGAVSIQKDDYSISFQFIQDSQGDLNVKKNEFKEKRSENSKKINKLKEGGKKEVIKQERLSVLPENEKELKKSEIVSVPSKKVKTKKKETETQEMNPEDNKLKKLKKDPKEPKYKKIKYKNVVEEDIEMRVNATNNGVKEDIVFESVPENHWFSYRFTISSNIYVEKDEAGNVIFLDKKTKEQVGAIPAPFMMDSSEEQKESMEVLVEVVMESETSFVYSMMPSREFLEAKDTKYPVTLDPNVAIIGRGIVFDTYISNENPNTNWGGFSSIKVGRDTNGYTFRSFVDMNGYPSIGFKPIITNCILWMHQAHSGTTQPNISVAPLGHYVDTNAATWNNSRNSGAYWDMKSSRTVGGPGWYNWDITNIYRAWNRYHDYYSNPDKPQPIVPKYGLYVISENEGTAWYKRFTSTEGGDGVYFTIEYTNPSIAQAKSTNGVNSASGQFDMTWETVPGAWTHSVGIFNGYDYDWYDVGGNWYYFPSATSGNLMAPEHARNIWPTPAEIASGRYKLHHDGKGRTTFPNTPMDVYRNAPRSPNMNYDNFQHYVMRVKYYDIL